MSQKSRNQKWCVQEKKQLQQQQLKEDFIFCIGCDLSEYNPSDYSMFAL